MARPAFWKKNLLKKERHTKQPFHHICEDKQATVSLNIDKWSERLYSRTSLNTQVIQKNQNCLSKLLAWNCRQRNILSSETNDGTIYGEIWITKL